uniref:Uncharacterized protein n=1 Tax=viral metagenome TaxID=1070528 RepID=A0A6M3KW54_9ZZZZ
MNERCEYSQVIKGGIFNDYGLCGRPAKYITPFDKMYKRRLFVCGIHRRECDRFHEKLKTGLKCEKI